MENIKTAQSINDTDLATYLGPFSSKTIEVKNIVLHYVEGGKGDTLLLLPG